MKTLSDELRTAETRYYIGQLLAILFLGILTGSFVGWLLWN
jgi:uncharacterized membrane protein